MTTEAGFTPAAKGEPGTGIKAPVVESMVYAETLFEPEFATYAKVPWLVCALARLASARMPKAKLTNTDRFIVFSTHPLRCLILKNARLGCVVGFPTLESFR